MRRSLMAMVVFALCLTRAYAGDWSGNDMLSKCAPVAKGDYSDVVTGICLGFVEGVVQSQFDAWTSGFVSAELLNGVPQKTGVAQWQKAAKKGVGAGFCEEKGLTLGQEVRVFVKYLKAHPELTNKPASGLLMQSLSKAFPLPCK